MSYPDIPNLYQDGDILLFRECWATEKIHGTNASVLFRSDPTLGRQLRFHAGDSDHAEFAGLFPPDMEARFVELGHSEVRVCGEHYGGKILAQEWRYGPTNRFVAFEVKVGECWLSVPNAADVAGNLGLEFVAYQKSSTDLDALTALRDAPSVQAVRNGVPGDQPREGIVLRPLIEVRRNNDSRIIAKYKSEEHRETRSPREIGERLALLAGGKEIAIEWVTGERLTHVLQRLPEPHVLALTGEVCRLMVEDVLRESAGEIVDTKEARKAIARLAAEMYLQRIAPKKEKKP